VKSAVVFALFGILSAAAQSPQPLHVGSGVPPPAKIKDVKPVYPADAQAARVSGVVVIEVTIREDGRVRDAVVLRSIPLLDQASLDAVRQWEFAPTVVNGKAVPVVTTVTVNFALQGYAPTPNVPVGAAATAPVRIGAAGSTIWEIPIDQAAALPHWNLDDSDPPVTFADARQIARQWLTLRNPSATFTLQSAQLSRIRRSVDVDFWVYMIAFIGPGASGPERLIVYVLPDRSVVQPRQ